MNDEHSNLKQGRFNVDSMSTLKQPWFNVLTLINVESTFFQRRVPAGKTLDKDSVTWDATKTAFHHETE